MPIFHCRNINAFDYEVLAQTPLEVHVVYAVDKISGRSLSCKYIWCKQIRKRIVGLHSEVLLTRQSLQKKLK